MTILAISILFFLGLRVLISLVNCILPVHLPPSELRNFPMISVLIPARNEEKNIGNLLSDLLKDDYPYLEIIVCNDHSEDQTNKIISAYSGKSDKISWFDSSSLPDDWIGKNYACFQLAQKATGDYYLFLDADVRIDPSFISKCVSYSLTKGLALLSVFPHLIMKSFGERITSPLMHWILVSLLPLPLVMHSRRASLSAAAGGCMLFDGSIYRLHQWHLKVKNNNVEDISIARHVKLSGFPIATKLGNFDFYAHMYQGFASSVNGYSKNVHQYFGGNRLILLLFLLIILAGPFIVVSALGIVGFLVFLIMVILNRLLISSTSRQNMFLNLILHPIQIVSFAYIVYRNIIQKFRRQIIWKGRAIKF